MKLSAVYGSALVAHGCWASFTLLRTYASRAARRRYGSLIVAGTAFIASCWLPGIALLLESFRPWMVIPLGLAYLVLIPHPCYFKWANDGWIHRGRTLLFAMIGVAFLAVGVGVMPLAWFGL